MPGRDGTGPLGQEPITGRMGGIRARRGRRRTGPAGFCICPACGEKVIHQAGTSCSAMLCPKCGTRMVRG